MSVWAKLMATGVAAALLPAACSGGDVCAADADCPLYVTHKDRPYLVSCDRVPGGMAGTELDVTSAEERDYGPSYGVDGFVLEGFHPDDALVVRFAQKHCGGRGPYMAYARDLPLPQVKAVHRRVARAGNRGL